MPKNSRSLPLLPLRGLSIFPYMLLHFDVGREKSVKALEEAMINDQMIFLVTQKDPTTDIPTEEDFYKVGTISKIKQLLKLPGDTIRVLVEGIARAEIKSIISEDPFFIVDLIEYADEIKEGDLEIEALRRSVSDAFEEYVKLNSKITPEILITISGIEDVDRFADIVASNLTVKIEQKQEILSQFDVKVRLEKLYTVLLKELEILELERKINNRVRKQIDKTQKEYYLREQIKAMQKELGDKDSFEEEILEYQDKLSKLKLPEEVINKVKKEVDRLSKLSSASPESGVIRTYLD